MSEFSIQSGARWVRSVDSESIPALDRLIDAATDKVDAIWARDEIVPHLDPLRSRLFEDSDAWTYIANEVTNRLEYWRAESTEQQYIHRALYGNIRWHVGEVMTTDGLWPEMVPYRTMAMNTLSRFVVSGAMGNALIAEDSTLLRMAEELAPSVRQRAVIIGGAAVYGYQRECFSRELNSAYTSDDESGQVQWNTWVGGTMHGDFRAERYARPVWAARTTLSLCEPHYFMPQLHEATVGAYHSIEPRLAASLLAYVVANSDEPASALRSRLLTTLDAAQIGSSGPFADYGDNDGTDAALLLEYLLKYPELTSGEVMYQSIVQPGSDERFVVRRTNGGVVLRNEMTISSDESHDFFIPNQEIGSFITTLATSNGGRTSPAAIRTVIAALPSS